MPMNEGDLKHVEALMSKRDHGSLMSLPSERLLLYAELADEVPSLIVEVRRLNLQISELLEALQHMKMCGSCGEDSWDICEGGRQAQAALDKATTRKSGSVTRWQGTFGEAP